mmetsp:Transcript_10764/g.30813  ORF Transcript_10764/g.30813 Transcript_10764/m.30813 type:complete len:253 (+) Transcript_10764:709-1467(+)
MNWRRTRGHSHRSTRTPATPSAMATATVAATASAQSRRAQSRNEEARPPPWTRTRQTKNSQPSEQALATATKATETTATPTLNRLHRRNGCRRWSSSLSSAWGSSAACPPSSCCATWRKTGTMISLMTYPPTSYPTHTQCQTPSRVPPLRLAQRQPRTRCNSNRNRNRSHSYYPTAMAMATPRRIRAFGRMFSCPISSNALTSYINSLHRCRNIHLLTATTVAATTTTAPRQKSCTRHWFCDRTNPCTKVGC